MTWAGAHDYLHAVDPDMTLFQCQEPSCSGYRRTCREGPQCTGTHAYRHDPSPMEAVDDHGQEDTPGLLIDDEGGGW